MVKMPLENVKSEFKIEFETIEDAEIILKVLEPEIRTSPSLRSFTHIKRVDKELIMKINAADTTSFRAAINSYLRWIMLSYDVLKLKEKFY